MELDGKAEKWKSRSLSGENGKLKVENVNPGGGWIVEKIEEAVIFFGWMGGLNNPAGGSKIEIPIATCLPAGRL